MKPIARWFRKRERGLKDQPTASHASSEGWTVRLDHQPRRYCHTAVDLSGPGIDDLIHETLLGLALSIHDADTRADSWADFLIVVGNLRNDPSDAAKDAFATAWEALAPDLPSSLRMPVADARYVGHLIDDVAGRVGTVKP